MNKKGFTEIQVTWIFILIAGTIILLLFGKIVSNLKTRGEADVAGITLTGLSSTLTSLSISSDSFHEGRLTKQPIKFSCDKYSIEGLSNPLGNLIVFSPNLLKGESYLSMTLPWHVPFKVANFIYLTHPEVRYVFVDADNNLMQNGVKIHDRIMSEIPDKMKSENKGPIESLKIVNGLIDKNNYKVRLIYFGETTTPDTEPAISLPNTKNSDITKLEITSDKVIKFYRKIENGWEDLGVSYYLDDEMLFGAIFSEDKETYECVSAKAFNILEKEAQLNEQIELDLSGSTKETDYCKNVHSNAKTAISEIATKAKELKNPPLTPSYITNIGVEVSALNNYNADAEKNSCVLIY